MAAIEEQFSMWADLLTVLRANTLDLLQVSTTQVLAAINKTSYTFLIAQAGHPSVMHTDSRKHTTCARFQGC